MVLATRSALSTTLVGELRRMRLDQSVNWYEPAGVFECVLRRVSHGACALADEVRIQLLTMRNPLSQEIPPVVMPLCEPCT